MLPREADATVDLDVLGRRVEVGLRAVRLGQRGHRRKLVVQLRGTPAGVVGGRLGRLHLEQHVGALVLDGLERPDGSTELHAVLGVLHGGVEADLGATDLLGGQGHRGEVQHPLEDRPAGTLAADQGGRHAVEVEAGLLAGHVHGGQRGAGQAGGVARHVEQRHAVGGAGRHQDQIGDVAVQDVHLRARQGPGVTVGRSLHGDAGLVPAAALLGEGQRGNGLARGDTGQQGRGGSLVTGVDQRVGGQHDGGEERSAQQGTTHLLEHHDELDVAEALSAVLLGDDEALQAELFGHHRPGLGVVADLGLHELTDGGLRRVVLEELADELPQLFLLLAECEVHVDAP